jgi:hypothetical protein
LPRKGESLEGAAAHGCAARHGGGGGRSKQDVCDWNPESPLLRVKKPSVFLLGTRIEKPCFSILVQVFLLRLD